MFIIATHTQLELQLSEAFKEDDEEEDGFVSINHSMEMSDSDSDDEKNAATVRVMSPETPPFLDAPNPFLNLEASLISLDMGTSSMMQSSVIDTEVRSVVEDGRGILVVHYALIYFSILIPKLIFVS